MNKQWQILLSTILVAIAVSGCGLRIVQGSGDITTESRSVSDFSAVDFTNFGDLTIVQGDEESLTITTDDNLLSSIQSSVSNGTLTIGFDDGIWIPLIRPTEGIQYLLTVKALDSFELSGAGTVTAAKLNSDDLTLEQSGAGEITIDDLTASELNVSMSGAGTINLAGTVSDQTVEMSGLGNYEAGDLASENADVTISGAGNATVWVTDSLNAVMSGVGNIRYYGSPKPKVKRRGFRNLQSLGDK